LMERFSAPIEIENEFPLLPYAAGSLVLHTST
jgi:hypothetical protein